jgi:hypothetical protein
MLLFEPRGITEGERAMKRNEVYVSYAKSFFWAAPLIAISLGFSIVVLVVFVDFIHGNPHRTKENALLIMALFPPIVGLIATVGSFLVFALPQCFQAVVSDALVGRLGRRGQFGLVLALPLTAVLAWYCYDYLTPSDLNLGINAGPDWTPYQHGLTFHRYLTMLIVQTPITLFSLWHCDATIRHVSRKPVIVTGLVFAVVVGVAHGYWMAVQQHQFL